MHARRASPRAGPARRGGRAQARMVVRPLRALLTLVLLSALVAPLDATRPSYAPTSKSVSVSGGLLRVYLEYDNFQGYFLNSYTLPAGARAAAALGA